MTRKAGSYREIAAVFETPEELEDAISALASAGWDRAEMSLVGSQELLKQHYEGVGAEAIADSPDVPREAVVSDPDVRQGRTLAAGMAGVVGAFIASGATIMTGGTVLAAVIGAAALGGGATLAVEAVGRRAEEQREVSLDEQMDHGGIVLWAKLRDAEHESSAREILAMKGAKTLRVHEIGEDGRLSEIPDAPRKGGRDPVDTASADSFPTSDPPGWISQSTGNPEADDTPSGHSSPRQRRASK